MGAKPYDEQEGDKKNQGDKVNPKESKIRSSRAYQNYLTCNYDDYRDRVRLESSKKYEKNAQGNKYN